MKSKIISKTISNSRNNTKVSLFGSTDAGENRSISGEDVGGRDGYSGGANGGGSREGTPPPSAFGEVYSRFKRKSLELSHIFRVGATKLFSLI